MDQGRFDAMQSCALFRLTHNRRLLKSLVAILVLLAAFVSSSFANNWNEAKFASRPLTAYPLPPMRDEVIGSLTMYEIQPGDTLLDVGRWYGLSAKEVSDANNHLDWWSPPAGKEILLPTEHILPDAPRVGIVLNIPEMRLYYFYPSPIAVRHRRKLKAVSFSRETPSVVYTFPVGLGRFDWKTPVGVWRVVARTKDPTWVVPDDIYQEHLERDGEADHVIPGGAPDNPLGHYRLSLSLPEYGLHGTDVPWGVGMSVSHGCVRLYPEDIERLYSKVRIGTPGRFVYQPIKFGWRGEVLYVEVHDDLYAMYPGLLNHAMQEVKRLGLENQVDMSKLEKAVELRSGIPTYVMPGPEPGLGTETANLTTPPASVATESANEPSAPTLPAIPGTDTVTVTTTEAGSEPATSSISPPEKSDDSGTALPARIINDDDE
ncbi:MAG: L,D-transpeptidase family protein [Deltaproteobacteria bacterium]|nr:L,D-transpeptidase family protein [Deltaproteobacteria bacterium]